MSDCWNWQRAAGRYGNVWHEGRCWRAHRWVWVQMYGPIPEGANVLHTCDNPKCVNPRHLFLGTQQDNVHDMMLKGRSDHIGMVGSANHRAKLTEQVVTEMRSMHGQGVPIVEIAAKYRVNPSSASRAVSGKTWMQAENSRR